MTHALIHAPRQPLPATPALPLRPALHTALRQTTLRSRPIGPARTQPVRPAMDDLFGPPPAADAHGAVGVPSVVSVASAPSAAPSGAPMDAEATGYDIGRDHARYGLVPPALHLQADSPVCRGWQAGRALFRGRMLSPRPAVAAWLALRLSAWQQGQVVEDVQLTPDFLRRIAVARCPVTREVLQALDAPARGRTGAGMGTGMGCITALPAANEAPAAVLRLRAGAAWAAGHLAVVSARAAAERGETVLAGLLQHAHEAQAAGADPATPGSAGSAVADGTALDAASALRLAVLVSFVTPLPHDQAVALPLAVLPPPRVRLLNAAQALQAMLTLQFTAPGWSQRLSRIEALVPGTALRRDFNLFVHALIPRVLEAGPHADATRQRHALEDAWTHPLVQRRWQRFARALGPEATEALVQRIASRRLVPAALQVHTAQQATEGWAPVAPQEPATPPLQQVA